MRIGVPFSLTPRYFDPTSTASNTYFSILYALHDALVRSDENAPTPSLAKNFNYNTQMTEFTYELKPGVKFHNGDLLTAEDVKFSLERYTGVEAQQFKSRISAIETPDAHTVIVKLKESWPDYPTMTGTTASAFGWIVPKRYYESVGPDGFLAAPVGAGPYKFEKADAGREFSFTRFDDYHGRKPKVERMVLRAVGDASQALAQVNSGALDVAWGVMGELTLAARKMPGVTVHEQLLTTIFFVKFFDAARQGSPWAKREVREAVTHIIDRQALSEIDTNGASKPWAALVPSDMEFAWQAPVPKVDVARAKELLKQAGYPNGFDGGKITPMAPYFRLGEAIQSMLAEVGIKVEMQKMERAVFFEKYAAKSLDGLGVCFDGATGNASTRLSRHVYSKGVWNYLAVPEIDKLFEAQVAELNIEKRKALLDEMQKVAFANVLDAPFFQFSHPTATGSRVKVPVFPFQGCTKMQLYELSELA
jgi:peptide/nickel transport system substrate-binding protein